MKRCAMSILVAFAMLACMGVNGAATATGMHQRTTGKRVLKGFGGKGPDFNAMFSQAQAAAQATAGSTTGPVGGNTNGCAGCGQDDYPTYNQCQAAASSFASASSTTSGRRLLNLKDTFSAAFSQANAQAGAASFGSPEWQKCFINACAAQASASASASSGSVSSSGRKLKGFAGKGKMPDFNAVFSQAQAAAQAVAVSGGGINNGNGNGCQDCGNSGYPTYNQCQAAASSFASASSTSSGRRLLNLKDTFSAAFSQANAQAGAASFGSPEWQKCFINACAAQASASAGASSFSSSGRKLHHALEG